MLKKFSQEESQCDSCGQLVLDPSSLYEYKGLTYCDKCLPTATCNGCEGKFPENELTDSSDGNQYCKSCTTCPHCNNTYDPDEIKWETIRGRKTGESGCPECMEDCNHCGRTTDYKDNMNADPDGNLICERCSEDLSHCEECGDVCWSEDCYYIEDEGIVVCESCFNDNYGTCSSCNQSFPINNLREDPTSRYHDLFCEECSPGLFNSELPEDYESLVFPEATTFHKFNRVLNQLKRFLPISPKDLVKKHPSLAASCKDLIAFAKGKELTLEVVNAFEQEMDKQNFPVLKSVWRSPLQRSINSSIPQLVLNIKASPALVEAMKADNTYLLFEKVNKTSLQSGHPHIDDQLGWVRLDLNDAEKYILVDEIQTDHMNAIDRIKKEEYMGKTYAEHIRQQLNLTEPQFEEYLNKYKNHIRDFPDIAMETITNFAKENGYKKIFYHTYESGKKLKQNAPPASLYTQLPARHYFTETEETPFNLEGKFFSRQASKLYDLCNKFYKLSIKN